MPRTKSNLLHSKTNASPVVPTTHGRKHFPDLIQDSYGNKSITGFDRYGRFLGAIVPPEAIYLLAEEGEVDDYARERIKSYAKVLLDELKHRDELSSEDDDVPIRD